jgi:anti-sigma regulatory factor (Ser/Thr protein kinase)
VEETHVEFDGEPSSIAQARRFARAVLEAGDATDIEWPVAQVVSELATNAVVHARTPFVLSISHDAAHIRVAVTDGRPLARASMRRLSNETTTGRGLRLVQTLGQAWGVDQTDAAKTVWCELVRGA